MSTSHNHKRTEPRLCAYVGECSTSCDASSGVHDGTHECPRRADTCSRYCEDHRLRTESPEGPMGRKLRLQHQANQVAEDGKFRGKTHVKLPAWLKARRRKLKHIAANAAKMLLTGRKKSGIVARLNPWAK